MQKKQIHVFYKTLLVALTEKSFLRKAGLKKKTVLSLLQRERWLDGLEDILRGEVSCAAVLELCAEAMETLAGKTPQEGWLSYTYRFLIREIYPARKDISLEPLPRGAVFFYLAALRVFMEQERERLPFSRTRDFAFAEEQEVAESPYREEYGRFLECFRGQWIYELMRLGREVMPFDTLAHVAGVHHVAMHVGRQLAEAGVPVDLGLISGAAAGHDIGKYAVQLIFQELRRRFQYPVYARRILGGQRRHGAHRIQLMSRNRFYVGLDPRPSAGIAAGNRQNRPHPSSLRPQKISFSRRAAASMSGCAITDDTTASPSIPRFRKQAAFSGPMPPIATIGTGTA